MINQNKSPTRKDYIAATLLASVSKLGVVFIALIAVMRACLTTDPDPRDDNVNARRRLIDVVTVVDTTHNGFKVIYATEHSVSEARLLEIRSRQNIKASFNRLRRDAPSHFGSLLYTDIYDFAGFAIRYDVDGDVKMDRIYVFGKEKSELYLGPNPNIEDPATWINFETEQGVQYINKKDIYNHRRSDQRIYRYWQCSGMNATSSVDEHFSHFLESERL